MRQPVNNEWRVFTYEQAGREIEKPEEQVRDVTKRLAFTEEQQDAVFSMFIKGGDLTAAGVLHAVTAAARAEADPDKSYEMEASAPKALELAAAL